ncbi:peptidoglycan/LPS O-acetylase OafA/YrhL [Pseudoduganella flava]|uniref:Acyltransferase family protein n=1 Tax=Pseudoduganella flava TaxID=871742 RepID=A0A562Q453_9BURK|nr:acyltransferase [Pseudoduganella flava]QGZ41538.1 acyltransferase family protein [Pseudoduganella flava]TWI51512.1 peptidoglycan/LPS O-acetylase OafA/YrhL [Pseudoduganella flava]
MRSEQLTYLDGWRGLAILLLLVGHFLPVPGVNLGAVGVRLFFALSGFLMARLLITQRVPIARFLRRRIARIFPAAYVFLAMTVIACAVAGMPVSWPETLAAATYLNNYFPGELGHAVMPFGHFWSLCVEEHSYLLLAVLAVLAGRARGTMLLLVALCLGVSIAAGSWYVAHYTGRPLTGMLLHTEVAGFTLFASVFLYLALGERRIAVPTVAWAAILCAAFVTQWWSVPVLVQLYVGGVLFALALNLLPSATPLVQRVLSWRPLRMLGMWSYSLYLWQQPAYLYGDGSWTQRLAGLALSIAAGVLSFYLVEQPARRYLNRKWDAAPAPLPQRAAA